MKNSRFWQSKNKGYNHIYLLFTQKGIPPRPFLSILPCQLAQQEFWILARPPPPLQLQLFLFRQDIISHANNTNHHLYLSWQDITTNDVLLYKKYWITLINTIFFPLMDCQLHNLSWALTSPLWWVRFLLCKENSRAEYINTFNYHSLGKRISSLLAI